MAEETKTSDISEPFIPPASSTDDEDEAEKQARERKEIFKHSMHHSLHKTDNDFKMLMAYESFDFAVTESALLRQEQLKTSFIEEQARTLHKWLMVVIVGILTACVAFLLGLLIDAWVELRIGIAQDILLDHGRAQAWAYFVCISLVYVAISAYFTSYHAPTAAGSGIPEVKSMLNGVNLRDVLSFKTLLIKFFGVTLAVGSGLCLGIEGPLVQTGSAIAMQIQSTSGQHKWDHFKKEYMACGTSAGIAAAFGAPSASVLFVMEEMASFWSTPLLWMVVLCSFFSALVLNICKAAYFQHVDYINNEDLIVFGQLDHSEYQIWEFISFGIVGVAGGLAGGVFNSVNTWISYKRKAYLWGKPKFQILQCLCVVFLTTSVFFVMPIIFDECVSNDGHDDDKTPLVRWDCPHGKHNIMANLTFQKLDDACLNTFHYDGDIGMGRLAVYFVILWIFSVITYGLQIPSGLIDPATFTGAAMGRFIGEFIKVLIDSHIDPGAYAVAGAAAFLGGITRLTLALAVLMLSVVNNQDYFLPMILVTLIAKVVGDKFNISLYDIHIELKNIPFVETTPHAQLLYLAASDVMRSPVITFTDVVNVKHVYDTLKNCSHNGFPIVNENQTLIGIILRHQLLVLIKTKEFVEFPGLVLKNEQFAPNRESIAMKIEDLRLESEEGLENFHIDLKPYLNESVVSIRSDVPCTAVYRTFRNLSLRHLVVRSISNKVIGIITRKELMTDFASDLS